MVNKLLHNQFESSMLLPLGAKFHNCFPMWEMVERWLEALRYWDIININIIIFCKAALKKYIVKSDIQTTTRI